MSQGRLQPPPTAKPPFSADEAGRRVEAARASGDEVGTITALADFGLVLLHEGRAGRASEVLREALTRARALGDPLREVDVLNMLGRALLALGRPELARQALCPAVGLARRAGDRFAEKAALDLLAHALGRLGRHDEALQGLDRALVLAVAVADRDHEADLLWHSALHHAARGDRDDARKYARWSVDLMRRLGRPQAPSFARQLARFEDATRTPEPSPEIQPPTRTRTPTPAPPGFLGMARGATEAMVRFVGSGFQTVPEARSRARLAVCSSCEHHTGLRCRLCGCFTAAKAKMVHERCPAGKWPD